MQINYLKSYDRSFRKLSPDKQRITINTIDSLLDFIKTGKKPYGLGLKKLRMDYWEIRTDIKTRIVFQFKKDTINFILVGSHDTIKNFLKQF